MLLPRAADGVTDPNPNPKRPMLLPGAADGPGAEAPAHEPRLHAAGAVQHAVGAGLPGGAPGGGDR